MKPNKVGRRGKRVVLGEGYLVHQRYDWKENSPLFIGLKDKDGTFVFLDVELYAWQKKVRLIAEILP